MQHRCGNKCPPTITHEQTTSSTLKVLPEHLCPSSGAQLTHKMTKSNGYLTQTTPQGVDAAL